MISQHSILRYFSGGFFACSASTRRKAAFNHVAVQGTFGKIAAASHDRGRYPTVDDRRNEVTIGLTRSGRVNGAM
jgi:hypothetical protein